MKASTLQNRIKKHLSLKDGVTAAQQYQPAIDLIRRPHLLHPQYWSRHKGICSLCGGHVIANVAKALRLLGVDFYTGNDASRGGKTGDFIALTEKGKKQTQAFRDAIASEAAEALAALTAKNERESAERAARLVEILEGDASSDEAILVNFFKAPQHPAPTEVYEAKTRSGKSWNLLSELYATK